MNSITTTTLTKAVSGKHILIDTNIIIYLTDAIEPYYLLSKCLFEAVERGEATGVFSIISIAETMQGPIRKGLKQKALDVQNYLLNFPNTTCQEITTNVLQHLGVSPRIDWTGLRTADSLILASGLFHHVDLVISNDLHFKKSLPKDFILTFDK